MLGYICGFHSGIRLWAHCNICRTRSTFRCHPLLNAAFYRADVVKESMWVGEILLTEKRQCFLVMLLSQMNTGSLIYFMSGMLPPVRCHRRGQHQRDGLPSKVQHCRSCLRENYYYFPPHLSSDRNSEEILRTVSAAAQLGGPRSRMWPRRGPLWTGSAPAWTPLLLGCQGALIPDTLCKTQRNKQRACILLRRHSRLSTALKMKMEIVFSFCYIRLNEYKVHDKHTRQKENGEGHSPF